MLDRPLDAREKGLASAKHSRNQSRVREALEQLEQLEQTYPRFSRLYEERGRCWMLLKAIPEAIDAFNTAVALNPSLIESWHWLSQLYPLVGDAPAGKTAASNVTLLQQLPDAVLLARNLVADEQRHEAASVLEEFLVSNPGNVGARHLLARIFLELGAEHQASREFEVVLAQSPDFHAARLDYSVLLLHQERYLEAKQHASILLSAGSENRDYIKAFCAACLGLGEFDRVVEPYRRLLAGLPDVGKEVAELRLWRGNALKSLGHTQEAIDDYHLSIRADRPNGVAWFSLANLKSYRFDPHEVRSMIALEATATVSALDRCYLCFALGKAHEDLEDYDRAWRYYERGNSLQKERVSYDPAVTESVVSRQIETLSAPFFQSRRGWGCPDEAPIFVVGLPRSGSTLIEQILASHCEVEGTSELVEIRRLSDEIGDLVALNAEDASRWGERYLELTRAYRSLGRVYFVDKMPNNFLHIGLIHLLLPNAKIIDVRREPVACCVANFKQLFGGTNQGFAYDLENLARYYRNYLGMMRHWERVLPNRILRIHYEDLVDDVRGNVTRLLDYCGLPFEPSCLDFHRTERSIRTPSSEQVREPINRDGLLSWKNFEPWLTPLKRTLGDAETRYRD